MTAERVTILGGGPSGLAAAFALSDPTLDYDITVYQVGWRCGGQAQSGRVPPEYWVNQNGTHYLFGCYANALYTLKAAYEVLKAEGDTRFGTFEEQLIARNMCVLKQQWRGEWTNWEIHFPPNSEPLGENPADVTELQMFVLLMTNIVDYLLDIKNLENLFEAQDSDEPDSALEEALGAVGETIESILGKIGSLFHGKSDKRDASAFIGGVGAKANEVKAALDTHIGPETTTISDVLRTLLLDLLEGIRAIVTPVFKVLSRFSLAALRFWILIDLGLTIGIGVLQDRAVGDMAAKLDHIDLRAWLQSHGAQESTFNGPPIQLWYDAMAAFHKGDLGNPTCAAGGSLVCMGQMVLLYKGSASFQLLNEVGDSVVGPIVAALQHRGVKFEYFHRVWNLVPDGSSVGSVELERQAELAVPTYDPFIAPINSRAVWPDTPNAGQLSKIYGDSKIPLDQFYRPRVGPTVTLTAGTDYDHLIVALSGGTLQWYCKELGTVSEKWANINEQLVYEETLGLRIWFLPTLEETGWELGPPVLSSYVLPMATWEDPTPVLKSQQWPADNQPQCISHLFGPMPRGEWPDPTDWEAGQIYMGQQDAVGSALMENWMNQHIGALWPNTAKPTLPNSLDVDRYCARPPQLKTNAGPIEAYFQLYPGTYKYRITQGDAGFDNLVAAGDWTVTTFPCGSIEGAFESGLKAGQAVIDQA